jgi:hypothetical protein
LLRREGKRGGVPSLASFDGIALNFFNAFLGVFLTLFVSLRFMLSIGKIEPLDGLWNLLDEIVREKFNVDDRIDADQTPRPDDDDDDDIEKTNKSDVAKQPEDESEDVAKQPWRQELQHQLAFRRATELLCARIDATALSALHTQLGDTSLAESKGL